MCDTSTNRLGGLGMCVCGGGDLRPPSPLIQVKAMSVVRLEAHRLHFLSGFSS